MNYRLFFLLESGCEEGGEGIACELKEVMYRDTMSRLCVYDCCSRCHKSLEVGTGIGSGIHIGSFVVIRAAKRW